MRRLLLLHLFFLTFTVLAFASRDFNSEVEFPNYFSEVSREQLEAATKSILIRLEVPVVKEGTVQSVRYFDFIKAELANIDAHVKVMPSGGVARATLSYIYAFIYDVKLRSPERSVKSILNELTHSRKSIPSFKVRGIGSDFDLLITNYETENFKALEQKAAEITNSLETEFDARDIKGDYKRSLFTIADIKDYEKQITRASQQGGSDIDFLAFDISKGNFIEPVGFEGIIQRFLNGKYRYLPPIAENAIEDKSKQTIRGLRPLLELPFLNLTDEGILRKEIQEILSGQVNVSSKALAQFPKMVRNARFSGAANRFYRGSSGSLESLIQQLCLSIEKTRKQSTVPEFVDTFPLNRERKEIPAELLISREEFITKHTDHGYLYHGTKDIESGMAIMRGGLFISGGSKGQGGAAFGRGGYLTSNLQIARGFAAGNGLLIRMQVSTDSRLVVFDGKKAHEHEFYKRIQEENPGRDPYEVLARDYGIDIIVNSHVLLQNMNAVVLPSGIGFLAKALEDFVFSRIENSKIKFKDKLQAFKEYKMLYRFSRVLEKIELKAPPPASHLFKQYQQELANEKNYLSISSIEDFTEVVRLLDTEKSVDKDEVFKLFFQLCLKLSKSEIKYPDLMLNALKSSYQILHSLDEKFQISDDILMALKNSFWVKSQREKTLSSMIEYALTLEQISLFVQSESMASELKSLIGEVLSNYRIEAIASHKMDDVFRLVREYGTPETKELFDRLVFELLQSSSKKRWGIITLLKKDLYKMQPKYLDYFQKQWVASMELVSVSKNYGGYYRSPINDDSVILIGILTASYSDLRDAYNDHTKLQALIIQWRKKHGLHSHGAQPKSCQQLFAQ